MYSNIVKHSCTPAIVLSDVSDHFSTCLFIMNQRLKCGTNQHDYRIFSDRNVDRFRQLLHASDFSLVMCATCVNKSYDTFINIYKDAFNTAFPLKPGKRRGKLMKLQPWSTHDFVLSSREKTKLFRIKSSHPTEENIARYQEHNRTHNRLKRHLKTTYYTGQIENNKHDMKKMWVILNNLIGKQNDKSSFPDSFIIDGKTESNPTHIASGFNKFFSEIGIQTANGVPVSNSNFQHYMGNPQPNSMYLEPVTNENVINTTLSLKSKISFGHDEISTKLAKDDIHCIITPK